MKLIQPQCNELRKAEKKAEIFLQPFRDLGGLGVWKMLVMELLLSLWISWAEGTGEKTKVCSVPGQKQHLKYPVPPFCDFDTPLFWGGQSWGGRSLAPGPWSLQLGWQRLPKIMSLRGRDLDVCQVGNASEDLRSPSLSRRKVTEMAFHELNDVPGFKANTAQKVFPSHKVLSQRSEVVPGSDGAQLPSQGTSHTTSVTTELQQKNPSHVFGEEIQTQN